MSNKGGTSISLVVQRYRSCKLLVDESKWETVPPVSTTSSTTTAADADRNSGSGSSSSHCGLLLYISFASSASLESVEAASETSLNIPILTTGLWGDGSSEQLSVRQMIQSKRPTSITIVPQANLISKVKSQGKSIQYHGQIDKDLGEELYSTFVDRIRSAVLEEQYTDGPLPDWYSAWKSSRFSTSLPPQQQTATMDPSIPETQVFRLETDKYGTFDDETGLPLTDASGQPLTKSALKKVRKLYDAQARRHAKWKTKNENENANTERSQEKKQDDDVEKVNTTKETIVDWDGGVLEACAVVAGSFGKRQGLEVVSDMGPFCHLLQL